MRALLGDRKVRGCWNYSEEELMSAVISVFALGIGPQGYVLDNPSDVNKAANITPDLATGNGYARVCYEAVRLMIGGEERGGTLITRGLTVKDSGDRQKSLLAEIGLRLNRLDDADIAADGGAGGGGFASYQSLTQFIGAYQREGMLQPWFDTAGVVVVDHIGTHMI